MNSTKFDQYHRYLLMEYFNTYFFTLKSIVRYLLLNLN